MADAGWVLAVDLGTGGPKTGAVSERGELLAAAHGRVTTRRPPGGGAVQDPEEWWSRITDGVAEVLAAGVDPGELLGVGITGQWGSTVPVAADGSPAGDCVLWQDTRGAALSAAVLGAGRLRVVGFSPRNILAWIRLTGGAPSPHGADPLNHELHLRAHEPDVYARATTLMEPLDYLAFRFTGRRLATPASMILSWLTDNRPGARLGYHRELVRRSTRHVSRLPSLAPTGSVAGPLLPEVAEALGLPAGLPVVTGVPDLHTAWLGSGAVAPFAAHLAVSTTCWISCAVPFKKTDVFHQVASVPGLRPGEYLVADNQETAGLCYEWFRDALAPGLSFRELDALAASSPPGAGGVLFMPWLNGERTPVEDRALRAGFVNVSVATDQARLARAVLEGVAHNARWLLETVERFCGRRLDPLRVLGGGAVSDLWCKILADVLDRRLARVADPVYANLRGAGLHALVALGRIGFEDAGELVEVSRAFAPDPSLRRAYDAAHGEFRKLYGNLAHTYEALNSSP